jgi:hypothetical protein
VEQRQRLPRCQQLPDRHHHHRRRWQRHAGRLYFLDQQSDDLGGGCTPSDITTKASALPDWYNAHGISDTNTRW